MCTHTLLQVKRHAERAQVKNLPQLRAICPTSVVYAGRLRSPHPQDGIIPTAGTRPRASSDLGTFQDTSPGVAAQVTVPPRFIGSI